jgi:hypothetical protein
VGHRILNDDKSIGVQMSHSQFKISWRKGLVAQLAL